MTRSMTAPVNAYGVYSKRQLERMHTEVLKRLTFHSGEVAHYTAEAKRLEDELQRRKLRKESE